MHFNIIIDSISLPEHINLIKKAFRVLFIYFNTISSFLFYFILFNKHKVDIQLHMYNNIFIMHLTRYGGINCQVLSDLTSLLGKLSLIHCNKAQYSVLCLTAQIFETILLYFSIASLFCSFLFMC